MKRGEVWTVAAGSGYRGKARPAVIIQSDNFAALNSVTVCLLSTAQVQAPLFRIAIASAPENGLKAPSDAMVDKIVTVPRDKLGAKVGALAAADMKRIDQSILVFLGLV